MDIQSAHEKIEEIFNGGVDHIHADMLHKFIDEQFEYLKKSNDTNVQLLLALHKIIHQAKYTIQVIENIK